METKSLTTLLDYRPAVNNLFTVRISSTGSDDQALSQYSEYHATAINLGEESLSFKRHPITKKIVLSDQGFKRIDEVTVTWRESDDWKVKRYHEDWMSQFYDKDKDCFISQNVNGSGLNASADYNASSKLFRDITIVFPKSLSSSVFNNDLRVNDDETLCLKLYKAYPTSNGKIDLSWSNSPSIIQHQIRYMIESWKWSSIKLNSLDLTGPGIVQKMM